GGCNRGRYDVKIHNIESKPPPVKFKKKTNVSMGLSGIERDLEPLSGMVVHQDQRGGGEFERALDHFARIDRRVIDGADLLQFVGDQLIALLEEQHAKLLLVGEGHGGAAIVEHARPG